MQLCLMTSKYLSPDLTSLRFQICRVHCTSAISPGVSISTLNSTCLKRILETILHHHFQESCSSCRRPYLRKGHLQTLIAKLKNLGIILDIFLSLIPTILTPAPGHLIIHLVLSALPPKYIPNLLTSLHFHCDHTIQAISFFTWDME